MPSSFIDPHTLSVLRISYQIILPIFIFVGITLSVINLIVLKSYKQLYVNKYFVVLSICDILIFISCIPTALSLNGCQIYGSRLNALYLIHGVNTFFYIIQTFSLYNVYFITYDRYQAIYDFEYFNIIKKSKIFFIERIGLSLLLSISLHLDPLINISVHCQDSTITHITANISSNNNTYITANISSNNNNTYDLCNRWVIDDGLSEDDENNQNLAAWITRGLFSCAIPLFAIITLSCFIISGVVKNEHKINRNNPKNNTRGKRIRNIMILFTCSFIICNFPILFHAAILGKNVDNCHGPFPDEVFRSVSNFLLLFDHMTHIYFLCFHINFFKVFKKIIFT